MHERFERMIGYATNDTECRSVLLQRYFGEEHPVPCGICDLCLARKRAARSAGAQGRATNSETDDALREKVLRRLDTGPVDPRELALETAAAPERLATLMRELLDHGTLRTLSDGRIERTE